MAKFKVKIAVLVLLAGALVVPAIAFPPTVAIRVATGLTSHTLCSAVFISKLDPGQVYAEAIKPMGGFKLISWGLRYHIDRARGEVTTSFLGAFKSRAVYRPGFGCTLEHSTTNTAVASQNLAGDSNTDQVMTSKGTPLEPSDPNLRAALDRAFAGADHTKAVVIMRDEQIVAERYAPGYGIDTPIHGWSATKSVTNALIGILVRQGRLSVNQPAPVRAWSDPNDPRHTITIDNLLRMTSGLAVEETNTGFDPEARMEFLEPDMAGFVERAKLKWKPGTRWEYTSGNTLILSKIIRDLVGGHAQDVLDFARRELFEPLGMHSVTIEFDEAGTPVGSSFMYATARDWARFGLLYLNDGVVDGRRILPQGWVQYSSSPTLTQTHYAAGFWTNIGQKETASMPPDSFFASGMLGQKIVMVPSQRLVVARFAVAFGPDGDQIGLGRLVDDAVTALNTAPVLALSPNTK